MLLAATALAACSGGGGGSKTSTPAGSASPGATAGATPGTTPATTATSSLGIRQLDLSTVPDVQAMIASTGGQYTQADVIYADLTQDGVDDAVVPIDSGGTMGEVGFVVLAPSDSGTKTLLKEIPLGAAGGLSVSVVEGQLVMTQPLYGPEDPNCCPSAVRKTTYVWNGTSLAVQTIKTDVNPSGGGKATATP